MDAADELMKTANETAAWQIKKDQEDILEKARLNELEYNKTKEENDAKSALLSAQKAE
jgi:hypothetical protein